MPTQNPERPTPTLDRGPPNLSPQRGGGPLRARREGAKPPLGYGTACGPICKGNAKRSGLRNVSTGIGVTAGSRSGSRRTIDDRQKALCAACADASQLASLDGRPVFEFTTFDHLLLWLGWWSLVQVGDGGFFPLVWGIAAGAPLAEVEGDAGPMWEALRRVAVMRSELGRSALTEQTQDAMGVEARRVIALALEEVATRRDTVSEAIGDAATAAQVAHTVLVEAAQLWELAAFALRRDAAALGRLTVAIGAKQVHALARSDSGDSRLLLLLVLDPLGVRLSLPAPLACACCGQREGAVLHRPCSVCAPAAVRMAGAVLVDKTVFGPRASASEACLLVAGGQGESLVFVYGDELSSQMTQICDESGYGPERERERGPLVAVYPRGVVTLPGVEGTPVEFVDAAALAAVLLLHTPTAWRLSRDVAMHGEIFRRWCVAFVGSKVVAKLRPRLGVLRFKRACLECSRDLVEPSAASWARRVCDRCVDGRSAEGGAS